MAEEKKNHQVDAERPQTVRVNIGNQAVEAILNEDGSLTMPEEVQHIMEAGVNVMQQAVEAASPADGPSNGETVLKDGNVADSFKGLPMRELIGGPLFAAAEAQEKLASIALDYYNKIAFYGEGEKKNDGSDTKKGETRILEFKVNRPVEENGKMTTLSQTVQAPFIGLVPIPSLLIDRIDIDFQMEVTDTNTTTEKSSKEASTDISAKWFGVQASISGKVSSSRENTRSTNQTAKYQVHVTASQQQQTEGLSKLMDIMASCVEPIPTSDSGGK